jgi:hypothetical protein
VLDGIIFLVTGVDCLQHDEICSVHLTFAMAKPLSIHGLDGQPEFEVAAVLKLAVYTCCPQALIRCTGLDATRDTREL